MEEGWNIQDGGWYKNLNNHVNIGGFQICDIISKEHHSGTYKIKP